MNRSEIATAGRRYLNELGTAYVSTGMMYDAINESLAKINTEAGYNRVDVTLPIHAAGREKTLPTGVTEIYRVRLGTGTQRTRLTPTDTHALDRDESDWESGTSGTPTKYYTDGRYIGFDLKPKARSKWAASTRYATGALRIPTGASMNGLIYKVMTAGTSAASQPSWPATIEGTVTDGGIKWKQSGSYWVWMRTLKNPPPLSVGTNVPSWLPERYHRTAAKGAAIVIAGGYEAAEAAGGNRISALYQSYMRDMEEIRSLARRRSKEYTAQLTPTGYGTFRRL